MTKKRDWITRTIEIMRKRKDIKDKGCIDFDKTSIMS